MLAGGSWTTRMFGMGLLNALQVQRKAMSIYYYHLSLIVQA